MATLNPNVMFKGNCEQAFDFYQTIFGGALSPKMRWADNKMPGMEVPEPAKHLIMHVSLPIGNESILMGGDIVDCVLIRLLPNLKMCNIPIHANGYPRT